LITSLIVFVPLTSQLSSGDHEHLNKLQYLRFLVIDEADRMVSQGNFPQLSKIFEKIQQANPSLSYLEANAVEDDDTSDDEDRLRGLPGVKGEAKVQMLDENILRMIEAQRSGRSMKDEPDDESRGDDSGSNSDEGDDDATPEPMEMDDDEYEAEQARMKKELEDSLNVNLDDDEGEEEEEPVKRQTFIFSATLSLPPSSHHNIKSQSKPSKKGLKSVDGAIAEIMEKVGAQGQIKVVDLSTSAGDEKKSKGKKTNPTSDSSDQAITTKLPSGLSLYEIKCTQKHKDSHLYAYLTTTEQGASGTALVFCNSIGAVKRVAETLKTLGLPTRTLHAQMEQKGRIASIESLNGKNNRSVVVCTDVAARGLDIPNVASVVHYDVPRAIDTFIHRAGRTARGMGENAVGWSVSLVSAVEEKNHQSICKSIKGPMVSNLDPAPMDSRLLSAAQERVNLASKIVACESIESRTNKKNQWFIEASKDAAVDLDEDLLESGLSAGSQRERQQIAEAKQARRQLKVLLAKPMRKQNFGKFLSNVGLQESIATEKLVKPHIVQQETVQKKKKTKR
jgi:ATP-dependent RNA helicase DDX24/MAK5